jgi:ketosteroid isomerase-like protein
MIQSRLVADFVKRLQAFEGDGNSSELIELFSKEAELLNLTRPTSRAHDGKSHALTAPAFFSQYMNAFDYVSSHFTNIIEDEDNAVLEWHSTGRLKMGTPVDYRGVTILDHDGKKISALRTYYDSAALLPNASLSSKTISETTGVPKINTEASS